MPCGVTGSRVVPVTPAAAARLSRHATKQVDCLLSNRKINVDDILTRWVPYVVGARTAIGAELNWTEFDADNQATIMLSLITNHGRATPLVWVTVDKRTLKHDRGTVRGSTDRQCRYRYRTDQRTCCDEPRDLILVHTSFAKHVAVMFTVERRITDWLKLISGETPWSARQSVGAAVAIRNLLHSAPVNGPIRFR